MVTTKGAQYLSRTTVRTLGRAGYAIIGTAATKNGVRIVRTDGGWIVNIRTASTTANYSEPTFESAFELAEQFAN